MEPRLVHFGHNTESHSSQVENVVFGTSDISTKTKQVEIHFGKGTDVPQTSFTYCLKYNTPFNEHTCINI